MYPPLIQLIVTAAYIGEDGHRRPGDKIAVTEQRARYLIELGNAKLDRPGPAENTLAAGPAEKKSSSGAAPIGRLTASPSSSEPGLAPASSSSPAGLASHADNAIVSPQRNAFRRRGRSRSA